MTPKEAYELRRQERRENIARRGYKLDHGEEEKEIFMDLADRFVTAFERIATALEGGEK